MSTYYRFRCSKCEEQGGFYSRQMWGWGNCDIFTNFKFIVAHTHCGLLEILSEYDEQYDREKKETKKWLERLAADEDLRMHVWPRSNEWERVSQSWEKSHDTWLLEFTQDLAESQRE